MKPCPPGKIRSRETNRCRNPKKKSPVRRRVKRMPTPMYIEEVPREIYEEVYEEAPERERFSPGSRAAAGEYIHYSI